MFNLVLPEAKEIGLAVCCDWHIGGLTASERKCKKWVGEIKDNGWYVILLGDLMENNLAHSAGNVHEQTMNPAEQREMVVKILDPVKEQIIGGVTGNHGNRTKRAAGIDLDADICSALGCDYFGHTITGRIKVGETDWKIVGHHCAGGGITKGAKLNAIFKIAQVWPEMDLYLGGHVHSVCSDEDYVKRMAFGHGSPRPVMRIKRRRFSGCGSALAYDGSYAEMKNYPPAAMAQVVHFLGRREHKGETGDPEIHIKRYRREVGWL